MKRSLLMTLTLVLYAVLISAVVWGMLEARSRALATFDTPQEQAHWERLRDDLDRRHEAQETLRAEIAQATNQPIDRARPKPRSPRPPTLELLQNHFAACLATAIAGATLLFAVMWSFFLGALLRPGRRYFEDDEVPTRAAGRPHAGR